MKIPVAQAKGKSVSSSSPFLIPPAEFSHQQRLREITSPIYPLGDQSSSNISDKQVLLSSRWDDEPELASMKQRFFPIRDEYRHSQPDHRERNRPRKRPTHKSRPYFDTSGLWKSAGGWIRRVFLTSHDRRSSAVILGVLGIMLLPFLAALVTTFWEPGDHGVDPLVRQALLNIIQWNNSTEAKWVDHIVISQEKDTTSIDILDTFHSRLNAELGPLISEHAAEIWSDADRPVLKCMSTETQIVSFSIKKSSRLPAICRFEERDQNRTIRDIRDLRISFPRKSSRYMLRVKIAEERTSHGDTESPRRFHSWGKFRDKFSVELLDTGKLALQRFCGETNTDVDMEPLNSKDIRLMSILELKRLYSLWSSKNITKRGVSVGKHEASGAESPELFGGKILNDQDDSIESLFRAVISPPSLTSNTLLSLQSVRHILSQDRNSRPRKELTAEGGVSGDSLSTEEVGSTEDVSSERHASEDDESSYSSGNLNDGASSDVAKKARASDQIPEEHPLTKSRTGSIPENISPKKRLAIYSPPSQSKSLPSKPAPSEWEELTPDEDTNESETDPLEGQSSQAGDTIDGNTPSVEVAKSQLPEATSPSLPTPETPVVPPVDPFAVPLVASPVTLPGALPGAPPAAISAAPPLVRDLRAVEPDAAPPVGVPSEDNSQPPIGAAQLDSNDDQSQSDESLTPESNEPRPAIVVQPTSTEGLFPHGQPQMNVQPKFPQQQVSQRSVGATFYRQPPSTAGRKLPLKYHASLTQHQHLSLSKPRSQLFPPSLQSNLQSSKQIPGRQRSMAQSQHIPQYQQGTQNRQPGRVPQNTPPGSNRVLPPRTARNAVHRNGHR